jgi:hypothetical protein
MTWQHRKIVDATAQELVARLSAEADVGEFLKVTMNMLARLRHEVDPRDPSNEQVALLQGSAVAIATRWGLKGNSKQKAIASIVNARCHSFYEDLMALETLFQSLPPAPPEAPNDAPAADPVGP